MSDPWYAPAVMAGVALVVEVLRRKIRKRRKRITPASRRNKPRT